MFNSSLKNVLLVFLLLFLTVRGCQLSTPSSPQNSGSQIVFNVSNPPLGSTYPLSYNVYCYNNTNTYHANTNSITFMTSTSKPIFSCTPSVAGSDYWASANVSGGDSCASNTFTVSSGLGVSITSPPSITAGNSVVISGTVSDKSATGSLVVSSVGTNCSSVAVSGSFSNGVLSSATVSVPSDVSSTTCAVNVSITYNGVEASDVIVFPVIGSSSSSQCTGVACNGVETCSWTSSCGVNTGNCSFVVGTPCGYNPSCSLSSNVSSVSSPGGSVAISGVLTGFSQNINSWSVSCGNGNSASGSCSFQQQSNGLYNGGCSAVCSYTSAPGSVVAPVSASVSSVVCPSIAVNVNALNQKPLYVPSCNVSINPTSVYNGSVGVSVGYTGLNSNPSTASLDCSGGLFSTENANLQCSGGYSGSSVGYAGSCGGSCSYNSTLSQQNVPLNVKVGGASCNILLTWLASTHQQSQNSSVSTQTVSSALVLNVTVLKSQTFFNESVIDPNAVLGASGVFNSTLPVDVLECVSPLGSGFCSCSVSGDNFNCVFNPVVNGSYVLVFKSGLSVDNNTSFTLNAGFAPSITTNVIPPNLEFFAKLPYYIIYAVGFLIFLFILWLLYGLMKDDVILPWWRGEFLTKYEVGVLRKAGAYYEHYADTLWSLSPGPMESGLFKTAKQLNSNAQARADLLERKKRGFFSTFFDFFSKVGLKGYFERKAKLHVLDQDEFKIFRNVIDLKSVDEVEKLAQRVYSQQLKQKS